jgi:hypothetical protein
MSAREQTRTVRTAISIVAAVLVATGITLVLADGPGIAF